MARCEFPKISNKSSISIEKCSSVKNLILIKLQSSESKNKKGRFKAFLRDCRSSLVKDIFYEYGAISVNIHKDWILSWTDGALTPKDYSALKPYQKINHFPGMNMICLKNLLARHLKLMKRSLPRDYNFFPLTFCLPQELKNLTEYCERRKYQDVFIIKPDSTSQGVGIEVIKGKVKNLKKYRNVVCQKYICKPFLMDGFKMDLRLYVLVTSVTPLRIYLYKEGLVRLATIPYKKPGHSNLNKKRMHLTNYAINRSSHTNYDISKNSDSGFKSEQAQDCKKLLFDLENYFSCLGLSISDTLSVIEDIIVKTVLSVFPELQHIYKTTFPCFSANSSCFEVLGFDILLDDKIKPYLLEVNRSPSFSASTAVDRELKENLIRNVLDMTLLTPKQINYIKDEEHLKSVQRLTNIRNVRSLTPKEQALFEYQERKENRMCGNFKKIYPVEDSRYDKIYETAFKVSNY